MYSVEFSCVQLNIQVKQTQNIRHSSIQVVHEQKES